LFGRHGVTWGDLAVTAKSPQVVCHLPDVVAGLGALFCQITSELLLGLKGRLK